MSTEGMTDGAPTDTLGEATKLRRERGHREKAASQWIEKELWSKRGFLQDRDTKGVSTRAENCKRSPDFHSV